jgi:glucose-1-phosphate adenylyltransferase
LTDWRAKPAVYFGGKHRIIDFPLSNCINSGVRRVGIATQYKSHSLIRHVNRAWGHFKKELGESVEILPASQRIVELPMRFFKTWILFATNCQNM